MCVAAATIGLIASAASAGLGALSAYSQYQQGKAQEEKAESDARAASVESSTRIEEQVRNDRYREGAEIANIANSGTSGSYGSPFLVALENAETAQANIGAASVSGFNQANAIRAGGQNAASQGRAALFGGIAGAAVQGFKGYRDYKKNQSNALYIGGSTVPGLY